jgi:hypothetical protein
VCVCVCVCGAVGKLAVGRSVFLVPESFLMTADNTLLMGFRPSEDLEDKNNAYTRERETTIQTFKL